MTDRNGTSVLIHPTAESAARAFLGAWERRNWALMSNVAQVRVRRRGKAKARDLEGLFGHKRLLKWAILGSQATGRAAYITNAGGRQLAIQPDAHEVRAQVTYRVGPQFLNRIIPLVVVREDDEGNPTEDGTAATWGVNPTSALREHDPDWTGDADPLAMEGGA